MYEFPKDGGNGPIKSIPPNIKKFNFQNVDQWHFMLLRNVSYSFTHVIVINKLISIFKDRKPVIT